MTDPNTDSSLNASRIYIDITQGISEVWYTSPVLCLIVLAFVVISITNKTCGMNIFNSITGFIKECAAFFDKGARSAEKLDAFAIFVILISWWLIQDGTLLSLFDKVSGEEGREIEEKILTYACVIVGYYVINASITACIKK